jgi:hypothetical protein
MRDEKTIVSVSFMSITPGPPSRAPWHNHPMAARRPLSRFPVEDQFLAGNREYPVALVFGKADSFDLVCRIGRPGIARAKFAWYLSL